MPQVKLTPDPPASKSSYRPEIDGLRAIAIIAIIINHFNEEILPSGYLGVDIFFVISGFVTTSSLIAKNKSGSFNEFLLTFYARRIKRIVPALIAFSLAAGIAVCMFDASPATSLKTGIASAFGTSNLILFHQSVDYFSDSSELNIFTHTWSLGVEAQFYIIFPLLIYLSGFKNQITSFRKKMAVVIGFLSSISLISFIYFYPTNPSASYFLFATRFWELGSGVMLCLFANAKGRAFSSRRSANALTLLIIISMVITFYLPITLASLSTMIIVSLTLILVNYIQPETEVYTFLTNPKVIYIGIISYSLYLWHWGILCISRLTIGIHWWSIPIQIALTVIAAVISFRYIESPLRFSKWPHGNRQSIIYWLLAASLISTLFFTLMKVPNFSIYMGNHPPLIAKGVLSLTEPYHLPETNSLWQGERCVLAGSTQARAQKRISIEECTLGNFSEAERRVAVFGNSFSAAFVQGFDDLIISDGYAVTITSSWDASPVQEIPNVGSFAEASNYYWNSIIPSIVSDLRPGDWVFLINDLAWLSPENITKESEENLKKLALGLGSLSDELSAKGIRLAVLHGNPFAREAYCKPSAAVKQWFQPFDNTCEFPNRAQSLARRAGLDTVLKAFAQKENNRVVDLFDLFCPGDRCTYTAPTGEILYRDEYSHPSIEAVRLSAPIIRQILTSH
ncbi:acyltransferase [Nodosilinea sp. LEGE 07088]|nr:acyltransferase [Nodosilinea sp. LEGE 07088]